MIHYHNRNPVPPVALCPNCGCKLHPFETFSYGNVVIARRGEIQFDASPLRFTKRQYLIVEALVRARGRGLTRSTLANIVGGEIYDETISKYIERIRAAFCSVKPDFDQISSVRGFGAYRWEYRRPAFGENIG